MKINAFDKIEKQARQYADKNHCPDLSVLEEIIRLEEEQKKILKPWVRIREEWCTGDPCRCEEHPRYNEFFEFNTGKFYSLKNQIDDLYMQDRRKKAELYTKKHKELLLARSAKLKYLNEV